MRLRLVHSRMPVLEEMRHRVDPLAASEPQSDFFREAHEGGKTLRKRFGDFRATQDPLVD